MKFIDKVKADLGLPDDHIDSHCSDLYLLPSKECSQSQIAEWAKEQGLTPKGSYSNVKGQSWYGKHFIEIPFALIDDVIADRKAKRGET